MQFCDGIYVIIGLLVVDRAWSTLERCVGLAREEEEDHIQGLGWIRRWGSLSVRPHLEAAQLPSRVRPGL
jgi:hypothetical protein